MSMEPWPAAFLCPISGSVMADPVIVSTGETYEKRCIRAWLELGQSLCIRKKSPIDRSFIVPNYALRNAIATMAEARGVQIRRPSASIARYLAERLLYEGTEENAVQAERGPDIGPSSLSSEEERHGLGLGTTGKAGMPRNGTGFDGDDPRTEANEGHGFGYQKKDRFLGKNVPDDLGFDNERSNGSGFSNRQPKTSFGGEKSQRSRQMGGGISGNFPEKQLLQKQKMDGSMPWRDGLDQEDSFRNYPSSLVQDPWTGEEAAEPDAGMNSGGSSSSPWQDRRMNDDDDDDDDDDAFIAITSEGSTSAAASPWPSHTVELLDRMIRSDSSVIPRSSDRPSSSKAAGKNSSTSPGNGSTIPPGNASITPPSLVFRPSSYVSEEKEMMPHRAFSLDALAEKLRDSDPRMQAEGASELRSLTRNEASRIVLCSSAIIQALIPLLTSQDPKAQIDATAALVNLSMEKQNKVKIAREGAIPALVKALKLGAPEARHHAAGVAFNLSLAEENRHLLGVLDAIPPLLDLLRSGPPGAQQDASLALYHLSLLQMNAAKLVKLRAIPILLNLAKSRDRPKVAYRALHILHNVASIPEGRASLLQLGAITTLVEVLASLHKWDSGGAQIQEQAASVLLILSKGNSRFKFMALQAGALEHLSALARHGTPRAQAKAFALLTLMKESSPEIEDPDSYSVISRQYMWQHFGGKSEEQSNTSGF